MSNPRWILTGASGQLGGFLLRKLRDIASPSDILALAGMGRILGEDGLSARGLRVVRIDLADHDALRGCLTGFRPTRVLHVGGITSVADACAHPARAEQVNVGGTRAVAEAAAACGARLLYASTDMVFDGRRAPYRESDPPAPLSRYGESKAAAERVLADFDDVLIVRLPLMYGFNLTDRPTTFSNQYNALRRGETLRLFTDEYRTPVWLKDAAAAMLALAGSDQTGIIHVAGPERLSRYEMVERLARVLGIADPKLEGISRLSIDALEPRPEDLSLDGTRFAAAFPNAAPRTITACAGHLRPPASAESGESGQ